MYLKQADLFWGMSQASIQSITAHAVKQEFQQGEVIFHADDPADFFYVLVDGKVRLELETSGRRVYTGKTVGEIFGWSALIDRSDYSAAVVCEQRTRVLRFYRQDIKRLLERDAQIAALFYRQLSRALGNRLLQAYDLLE